MQGGEFVCQKKQNSQTIDLRGDGKANHHQQHKQQTPHTKTPGERSVHSIRWHIAITVRQPFIRPRRENYVDAMEDGKR